MFVSIRDLTAYVRIQTQGIVLVSGFLEQNFDRLSLEFKMGEALSLQIIQSTVERTS